MHRFCKWILLFISVLNTVTVHANVELKKNEYISINILSKHIRLIREGRNKDISIYLPENTEVIDNISGKPIITRLLRLYISKGSWALEVDDGPVMTTVDILCRSEDKRSTAEINIKGERRWYPLPLNIAINSSLPVITVKENIYNYAADSAISELGHIAPREDESLKALISVILARSIYAARHPYHSSANFCDLTHCQVYRGRRLQHLKKRYMVNYFIDIMKTGPALLFHSSCGGKTFDNRVFGNRKSGFPGVKDILYRDRTILCKPENKVWERSILRNELAGVLKLPAPWTDYGNFQFKYDMDRRSVSLSLDMRKIIYPSETFRLKLNRIKGWNFIKSNNYSSELTQDNGEAGLLFRGKGLGHGVGICQHGSLELSRRGYSWYEILHHYYRGIKLVHNGGNQLSPGVSYGIFDVSTGKFNEMSNRGFLNRKFPPGSFWKLIVALYIAKERQDIFKDYRYRCTGISGKNGPLPKRCWKPGGHGVLNFSRAISHSCNLYFASLYKRIDLRDFRKFYTKLCLSIRMADSMPEVKSDTEAAALLAGLDFRISFTVRGLVKIAGILNPEFIIDENVRRFKKQIPLSLRIKIWDALQRTFTHGTGKFSMKNVSRDRSGSSFLYREENRDVLSKNADGMWGKTSTVIDGTNLPLSYGIFLGGYNDKSIIVILREGVGNRAAQWGKLILLNRIVKNSAASQAGLREQNAMDNYE